VLAASRCEQSPLGTQEEAAPRETGVQGNFSSALQWPVLDSGFWTTTSLL
jgi:hypothetical protein